MLFLGVRAVQPIVGLVWSSVMIRQIRLNGIIEFLGPESPEYGVIALPPGVRAGDTLGLAVYRRR
jgi:hypothetical protein